LIEWVKEARVFPKTWVLAKQRNRWCPADTIETLRPYFLNASVATIVPPEPKSTVDVSAEELRQFSAFSGLSNHQLDQFIQFGELIETAVGQLVIRRDDPSDSLFFLLSGQLRARLIVGYEDKTLGRVKAGDCFGEIAMFVQKPRTADVITETEARMLRVTSEAFLLLMTQLPQIAAPILFGMARVMAERVSERNQQFQRDVASEFLWR